MTREEKIQALLDQVAEREAERDNLAYDLAGEHRWEWRRFVDAADVGDTLVEWMDEDPQWPRFGRELMAVLQHGGNVDELANPQRWAVRCHEIAADLPEFDVLVDLCMGKRWDAGCAAMALGRAVLREWQNQPPMPPPQPQDEEPPQEPQNGPHGDEPDSGGQDTTEDDSGQQGPNEGRDDGDGDEPGPQLPPGQRREPLEASLRQAVRDAVRRAIAETQETQEAIAAMVHGLTGSGTCHVPPEERDRLAKLLRDRPELKRAMLEMGRLLRVASAKRRSDVLATPNEITAVKTGQDIAHTIASELGLLGRPDTAMEFCRRYLEHQTLVYETTGKESVERGPVVVLLDVSGSMNGDPMTHAVATALALCHNAVREDRAAVVVPFDTRCHDAIEFSRRNLLDATVKLATIGAHGGGTIWKVALDDGRARIERDQSSHGTWEGADLVLITDGECTVDHDWAVDFDGFKRAVGVSVFSMLVVGRWTTEERAMHELRVFSDEVFAVSDLADLDDNRKAGDIIARVQKGKQQ
jgi:Mg-chelatase subunit ChlD